MSTDRNRTFIEATNLLAHRAVSKASHVSDPDGYHRVVLTQKRRDHHPAAMAALDENPDMTAGELADMLEPGSSPLTPGAEPTPQPPLYEAEPWRPATAEERRIAKAKLAAARDALKERQP